MPTDHGCHGSSQRIRPWPAARQPGQPVFRADRLRADRRLRGGGALRGSADGSNAVKASDLHARWRALPTGTLDEVLTAKPCLVLAPHPDDESLGCGGLIAACCAAGRPPVVVSLTDGSASHLTSHAYPPHRLAAIRAQEVKESVGHLGLRVERLIFLGVRGYIGTSRWGSFRTGHASARRQPRGIGLLHHFRSLAS